MNKFRIFLFYSGLVDIKAREGHDAVKVFPWSSFSMGSMGNR